MPGIFGNSKQSEMQNVAHPAIGRLFIHYEEMIHLKSEFENGWLKNTVVSFDFQKGCPLHFDLENLELWIYGDPLVDNLTGANAFMKTVEVIHKSYPDFSKLNEIDGLFNILLYDKRKGKLFLINDRNGLAHLYFGVFNNQLVWGSELRYFVNKSLKTTITKESINDFLNLGYLIGDDTWFKEVKLLAPASYIEWDLKSSKLVNIQQYWSHKSLKKDSIFKSSDVIIKDLKDLFQNAVEKRVSSNERVGITLSGGLDSRLIFANIPIQNKGFTAITRGMENAGDIELAEKTVQKRDDCSHIVKNIYPNNWVEGREKAIKATSGQKTLFDMNAISSLPIHKKYFDINLDGAGGDGIFQGGQMDFEKSKDLKTTFKNIYFKSSFNDDSLKKFIEYYKTIDSDQHFYIYERIRRFTVFGSILGHDYGIVTRFPFLDNELQDYFYQIDSSLNINKLYYKMLIKYFPQYFIEIDCLDTGTHLFSSSILNLIAKAKNRLWEKFGIIKYNRIYHNYPRWLRENNQELLKQYILDENLYLYNFIAYNQIKSITNQFLEKGDHSKLISRLLTLSVFLEDYRKLTRE